MNVSKTKRIALTAQDGRSFEIESEERSISINITLSFDDDGRTFIFNKAELGESAAYRSELKAFAKELMALADASTPVQSRPQGY